MNAIVFGGTGLVGNEVIKLLSSNPNLDKIGLVSRRQIVTPNPKCNLILSDLNDVAVLSNSILALKPAFAICCLGTTIKKAGSKEALYHVDHDLVLNAAEACYKADVKTFAIVSSIGAKADSSIFYLSMKGKTENDLKKIGFQKLIILRPGVLLGTREESRPLEALAQKLAPMISSLMIGPLKKYKPVAASKVASTLIEEALKAGSGTRILESFEI
jgi:uncharacterized protein YbjT (DUF2867 family)